MLALTNLILHDIEIPNIIYDDALSKEISSISKKDKVDCILANPPFGGVVTDGMETNFPANFRTKESADLFFNSYDKLPKRWWKSWNSTSRWKPYW